MGQERKIYENLVEMTHIYHEMRDAGLLKAPVDLVPEYSTISGYDKARDDLIGWAEEFEKEYPDTEEYLTDIREFAEAKLTEAYGTALGKEKRRADRVMAAMKGMDWAEFLKQKSWLSRQAAELEAGDDGTGRYPDGILHMMVALQDAWEGEGMEAARTVWAEFCGTPQDPVTGRITRDWRCFRAGTHRSDIRQWFEQVYGFTVYGLF